MAVPKDTSWCHNNACPSGGNSPFVKTIRVSSYIAHRLLPRPFLRLAIAICLLPSFAAILAASSGESGKIHWKQVPAGQVKLDGKAPINWNIYQPDKKKLSHLVLILLGHRYLAINLSTQTVYSVNPKDLQAQGKDFESDSLENRERIIASTNWTDKDVGPEERIQLTLCDYGRVLEIELPHMQFLY